MIGSKVDPTGIRGNLYPSRPSEKRLRMEPGLVISACQSTAAGEDTYTPLSQPLRAGRAKREGYARSPPPRECGVEAYTSRQALVASSSVPPRAKNAWKHVWALTSCG